EWLSKLNDIQHEIQSQRYQFEQQQPCLFIEDSWLAEIESSFIKVTDKLIQLRSQIIG
ncbi:ATPase RavA domain-containing protein, partial [Pseudomonas marginalis]